MNTTAAHSSVLQPGNSGYGAVPALPAPRALDAEYEWLGYEAAHPTGMLAHDWPGGEPMQPN